MKIRDLELAIVEIPLRDSPLVARSLLVRIVSETGAEGWGESAGAWRAEDLPWRAEALLSVLAGRNLLDVEQILLVDLMQDHPLASAVQMALWDIIARIAGQPLCRLMGGVFRGHVPLAARLPEAEPDLLAIAARELAAAGFATQIIAASGDGFRDADAVVAVQAAVGERVEIRLDGQSRYRLSGGVELLTRLRENSLAFIQDFWRRDVPEQAAAEAIRRDCPIRLAEGTCIHQPSDVLRAMQMGGASHAVVDPGRVGGVCSARDCVAVASAGRISASLATPPCLGVATAAAMQLAAALPALDCAQECWYHQLTDDILIEPLQVAEGMIAVPQAPGLGVVVDRAKVERYQVG